MASVFQRRGRDGWWVRYADALGRVHRERLPGVINKTEARLKARELDQKVWRQKKGLDAMPSDSGTLWETCDWWLKHKCPALSRSIERDRLEKHVKQHPIASLRLMQVTAERVDELLTSMEARGAAAASVNKLRAVLHSVFSKARKARRWNGSNPIGDVEPRRVIKRRYHTLRTEEVPVLLEYVDTEWRNFFAAALYTGMRKGELCGLLKSDIDLQARTINVARSYENETTKGGHADTIPIAAPLVPILESALKASTSKWVFPDSSGSMRTNESDPQKVLRTALKKAGKAGLIEKTRLQRAGLAHEQTSLIKIGLIEGFEHVCRRCKAAGVAEEIHTKQHSDGESRRCENPKLGKPTERCNMLLWARPLPRPLRFHDLRHTAATLMLRAGIDPHRVQRVLRHADMKTTLGTYGHLDVDDLREAVNSIAPTPAREPDEAAAQLEVNTEALTGTDSFSGGAPLSTTGEHLEEGPETQPDFSSDAQALLDGRSRFRTCDPCRVNPRGEIFSEAQRAPMLHIRSEEHDRGKRHAARISPGLSSLRSPRGAPLSTSFSAPMKVILGGLDALLSVGQVAQQLGYSTATVYALIKRGELPHVRLSSNAIRIEPADLAAYRAARRGNSNLASRGRIAPESTLKK